MYSTRDELRSVGKLHQHLRRADSRSCFQCSLRLCNPGPANGQNMAAAYVTQEETGRLCGVLCGSIVNLPFLYPSLLNPNRSTAVVSQVYFD